MSNKILNAINDNSKIIKPIKDILWFLFLFLLFDFIWKLCIHEGADEASLFVFGKDYTETVKPISVWTAKISHWVVATLLGHHDFKIDDTTIFFDTPQSLRLMVIWGCTSIKQIIMFSFIIICYYGPWKQKLWFVPMSVIILVIINIIRIVATALVIKEGFPDWFIPFNEWKNNRVWDGSNSAYWLFYTDWFQLFHKDVFKWLYYDGVIFLLWLLWQEKFNLPLKRKKELDNNEEQQTKKVLK